ncbi:hypothetical protein D3C81_1430360 [compost metagenome]
MIRVIEQYTGAVREFSGEDATDEQNFAAQEIKRFIKESQLDGWEDGLSVFVESDRIDGTDITISGSVFPIAYSIPSGLTAVQLLARFELAAILIQARPEIAADHIISKRYNALQREVLKWMTR